MSALHEQHDAREHALARIYDANALRILQEVCDTAPAFALQGIKAQRAALLALAKQHAPGATQDYAYADTLYWNFAARYEKRIHQWAQRHATRSHAEAQEVLVALQEGAYHAAVAWDPSRGPYTGVLTFYLQAAWQHAPERQATVHLNSREARVAQKGYPRAGVESLDAPVNDDTTLTRLDILPAPAVATPDTLLDAARVARWVSDLPPRQQVALRAEPEDRHVLLGVSRAQGCTDARKAREALAARAVAPAWRCAWPDCDATEEKRRGRFCSTCKQRVYALDAPLTVNVALLPGMWAQREAEQRARREVAPPPTPEAIAARTAGAAASAAKPTGRPPLDVSDEALATAQALRAAGVGWHEIAAQTGVTRSTLIRRLRPPASPPPTPPPPTPTPPTPAPPTPPPTPPPPMSTPTPPPAPDQEPRAVSDIVADMTAANEALRRAEARLREDTRVRDEKVVELRALNAELTRALS